jgi:hypothetical protein
VTVARTVVEKWPPKVLSFEENKNICTHFWRARRTCRATSDSGGPKQVTLAMPNVLRVSPAARPLPVRDTSTKSCVTIGSPNSFRPVAAKRCAGGHSGHGQRDVPRRAASNGGGPVAIGRAVPELAARTCFAPKGTKHGFSRAPPTCRATTAVSRPKQAPPAMPNVLRASARARRLSFPSRPRSVSVASGGFWAAAAKRCVGRENVAGQKSSAMTRDTCPRWSGGHRPRRSRVGRENVIRADISENIRGRTWRPYPRPIAAARPQQLNHDQSFGSERSAVANPPAVRPKNALKVSKAAKKGSRKKLSPPRKRVKLTCFVFIGTGVRDARVCRLERTYSAQ